jgi:putative ABC transport system permease protein
MTVGTALLATLLCAIGCAALLMSFVREAQQEIAIRLALGSSTKRLTQHVTFRALLPSTLGLVVGLYAAWLVAGHIGEQLYETNVHELDAFAIPAVLLLAIAVAASYFPVRIATRTNPGILLRES